MLDGPPLTTPVIKRYARVESAQFVGVYREDAVKAELKIPVFDEKDGRQNPSEFIHAKKHWIYFRY